jgi:hypothetical protein
MIHTTYGATAKLERDGFLYRVWSYSQERYDAHGKIPLTINEHAFEYVRCQKRDEEGAHTLYALAYVSTNTFSEAANVAALREVLGDTIKFTLYKDVTTIHPPGTVLDEKLVEPKTLSSSISPPVLSQADTFVGNIQPTHTTIFSQTCV